MSTSNSVDIVHAFWDQVWNAHDPAAVDRFVVDDFVIVTGGETITGRENFKQLDRRLPGRRSTTCIWRSSSRSRTPTAAVSPPAGC